MITNLFEILIVGFVLCADSFSAAIASYYYRSNCFSVAITIAKVFKLGRKDIDRV